MHIPPSSSVLKALGTLQSQGPAQVTPPPKPAVQAGPDGPRAARAAAVADRVPAPGGAPEPQARDVPRGSRLDIRV